MFFDRPTTQAVFPNVSTWHLFNISNTPSGVAGMNPGSPVQYRPKRSRSEYWSYQGRIQGTGMKRAKLHTRETLVN